MMDWLKLAAATAISLHLFLDRQCRSVHAEDGFWIGMSDDIFMTDDNSITDDDFMSDDIFITDDNFIADDGYVLEGDCSPEDVLADPDSKQFNSTFSLSFSSDILNATEDELSLLKQAMLFIFNNEGYGTCDLWWPYFDSIEVYLDFPESRRLRRLTRSTPAQDHSALRRKILEEDTTSAPSSSMAPSAAPTTSTIVDTTIVDEGDFVDVFFTISGTCTDCDPESGSFGLFLPEDVSGNEDFPSYSKNEFAANLADRINEADNISFLPFHPEYDDDFIASEDNDDSFGEIFCTGNHTLVEIVETVTWFGSHTVTLSDLDEAFVCSYNGLTDQSSCGNTASIYVPTTYGAAWSLFTDENSFGNLDVPFELKFCCDEQCMDCTSIFHRGPVVEDDEQSVLFDTSSFTTEGDDGKCFCDSSSAPKRAPTRLEFEAAFQLCDTGN